MNYPPTFCSEPWGFALLSEQESQIAGPAMVSGEGSPRAFAPVGHSVNWGGATGRAPRAGPSFIWDGRHIASWHVPAGHRETSRRTDLEFRWRCLESGSEGTLLQTSVLQRPEAIDTNSESATQGRFLDWLIHSFQELGQDKLEGNDSAASGVVRRDWNRADAVWLDPDPNEPRIELIIRMAQDKRLRHTLESISHNPRRILLRVREQTPISRIKELDTACIRSYVRRSGRDAIEKAGTRQELLAVQRRASHDTLENRVTAWTLENLILRAERWKRLQGTRTRAGMRFRAVSSLARDAFEYRTSEDISEAQTSSLSHPVPANYPLMMEPRYKRVYLAYRELLRYEKIKDDSWTWRRVLWSEAVTQLLSCTLRRLFDEVSTSFPYYRSEPDRGRWLLAPASAGPFFTKMGPLYVIDTHEADLFPDGQLRGNSALQDPIWEMLGVLGCDLLLWWPDKGRFFPVWSLLWTGDTAGWNCHLENAARAIHRFSRQLKLTHSPSILTRGLVVGTSLANTAVDIDSISVGEATAVGIPVPMALESQNVETFTELVQTLSQAIELAVDHPQ